MNALSRSRRRSVAKSRRRKVRVELARGMYHPAFENRGAWIEIFVDNTLRLWGRRWWLAWLRDMELSGVLFHEIGHHIHYTARPEYREKEDVADVWKVRLQKTYQRGRYPWLRLLLRCSGLGTLFKHIEYRHRWMFRKGYISRAEYEESIKLGKGDKVPNQS